MDKPTALAKVETLFGKLRQAVASILGQADITPADITKLKEYADGYTALNVLRTFITQYFPD
jgi:hypothetical protein